MTQYNLTALDPPPGFPRDSYLRLEQIHALKGMPVPGWHANGFDIQELFPGYMTDWQAATGQMLSQLSDLQAVYPGLRFTAAGYPPQVPIGRITQGLNQQSATHGVNAVRTGEEILTRRADLGNASLHFAAWRQSNLSQSYRRLIQFHAQSAVPKLRTLVYTMMSYCATNQLSFSLRPLIAFPNARVDELLAMSPTAELKPEMFYTHSQALALEVMRTLDLPMAQLFNPYVTGSTPLYDDDAVTRYEYSFWFQTTANAVIVSRDTNDICALIPSLLPPFLFRPVKDNLPFYISEHDPYFFVNDAIARVSRMRLDDIYNRMLPSERRLPPLVGRLMALIAIYVSLIVANIQMGRGHRKPSWIHSPLNPKLLAAADENLHHVVAQVESYK